MGHPQHSWTCTSALAYSKKLVDEINLGGTKGATTRGSKTTAANDPYSENDLTSQKARRYKSPGKAALSLFGWTACSIRPRPLDARNEYIQGARRGEAVPCGALHRGNTVWIGWFVGKEAAWRQIFVAWWTQITHPTTSEQAERGSPTGVSGMSPVGSRGWATNLHCHKFWKANFTRSLVEWKDRPPARSPARRGVLRTWRRRARVDTGTALDRFNEECTQPSVKVKKKL